MGGWSNSLKALLIFVVIDYVSGFFAACKEGKLSSQVGMMEITKKVMVIRAYCGGPSYRYLIGESALVPRWNGAFLFG
ncbi:phage holin family protein [Laceyella tengchongensis]